MYLCNFNTVLKKLIIFIQILVSINVYGAAQDSTEFALNLNRDLLYLQTSEQLSFEDALYKLSNKDFLVNVSDRPLNFGYTSDNFWVYTEFVNQSDLPKILELPYPYHQNLTLYVYNESIDSIWRETNTGTLLNFDTRGELNPLDYAWPIVANEGDKVRFLLHISSKAPVIIGLTVHTQYAYSSKVELTNLIYGIFFGTLLIMIFYNLFLFVIIRDITYLYYVLLVIANAAVFASVAGFFFKYLHPELPEINLFLKEFLIAFLTIPTSLFAISFLELREKSKWAFRVLVGMIMLGSFICISTLFGITYGFSSFIISVQAPLLLVIGIVERIKGNKIANFYILAWSGYLVGGLAMTLRNQGTLPAVFFTDHGAEIGTVLDLFLLALALANKYKLIRNEKSRLQKENIRLIEEQNEILEEKVRQRTELISSTLDMVKYQHDDLQSKSTEINSSIAYALKIQESMFPTEEKLNRSFKDVTLFYQPKEVVSGDFFFFEKVDHLSFVAVVDCTGHGVPGALMSMVAYNLFYDAINVEKLVSPKLILEYVEKHLNLRLNQKDDMVKDGMEAAICVIDTSLKNVCFSGAQRPLLIVNSGEIELVKGSKRAIGGHFQNIESNFIEHNFSYNGNTSIYLYSDGFQDQFGGQKNKKYLSKNMISKLSEISRLDGMKQHNLLDREFNAWKGGLEQVDDVLVLGLKL